MPFCQLSVTSPQAHYLRAYMKHNRTVRQIRSEGMKDSQILEMFLESLMRGDDQTQILS